MTENQPLKNYYGLELAQQLAERIQPIYPAFDTQGFLEKIAAGVETLELKDRVKLIAEAFYDYLPSDYPQALHILMQIMGPELDGERTVFNDGYHMLPISQYVESYGLEHYDESVHALYEMTKRFSSEFAIRPFIERYPEKTLAILRRWTQDKNHRVRRLVSEGTRPRLPWAMRLTVFAENPRPTLELLAQLKNDPSLYVRKSVANHLNDLSKDHPDLILDVLTQWSNNATPETRWIIRHALRTLVKQGHAQALQLLGYKEAQIALEKFEVEPAMLQMPGTLLLRFTLKNESDSPQNVLIDYRVHFVKANGKTSPKVFKLTTRTLEAGKTITIEKKQPIRPITTRVYYPGVHRVELQINGAIMGQAEFELVV